MERTQSTGLAEILQVSAVALLRGFTRNDEKPRSHSSTRQPEVDREQFAIRRKTPANLVVDILVVF